MQLADSVNAKGILVITKHGKMATFASSARPKTTDIFAFTFSKKTQRAMALLRAVAFGWQQSVLTENAGKIRDVGTELHKRLTVFINHVEKLGKNLESGVDTYNRLLGSLERSVLPGAKKLAELGVSSGRNLADAEPLEISPRVPVQSELELEGIEIADDIKE